MNADDQRGRPWLAQYPSGVPKTIAVPETTLDTLFDEAVARYLDRPFLDFLGSRMTYAGTAALIDRAAAGFRSLGVRRDTRVALYLPNTAIGVVCYFAILKAAGTVVNINPLAAAEQVLWQIQDSGAEIAVTVDLQPMFSRIMDALGQTGLRNVVVCRMVQMLPFPQNLAFRLHEHARLASLPQDERVLTFSQLTERDVARAISPAEPADIAVIQYTGGTTGRPKGVSLSHASLCANVRQLCAWFVQAEPGNERLLAVLPFGHCFGMTAVMNFAVGLGAELIILPCFRPADVLQTIRRRRITLLVGVPAMFQALLDSPAARNADFSSLKVCVCGGDVLTASLAERFTAKADVKLAEGYGLTECSPVVTCSNPLTATTRPGSCGVPLPGTDLAIMSTEPPIRILPFGEIGEICVRGPQVMRGYWHRPGTTAETLRDGWLHTGDLGRLDPDGYLYFVNRRPEVIAVQGYKVYAQIVEEAIRQHPSISEVAVVGVPDRMRGEMPKACIVLQPGKTLDEATLRAFLASKLSPVEMPRIYEFRPSLPKSPFGKILKQALRDPPCTASVSKADPAGRQWFRPG